MITKSVYKALRPFRDGPVRREEGPDGWIEYLVKKDLIETAETIVAAELTLQDVAWTITPPGVAALEEYEAARKTAFWSGLRLWITAFIAAAAFVKSFWG